MKINLNNQDPVLMKRIIIVLLAITLLIGSIFIYHAITGFFIGKYFAKIAAEPMTVAATKAGYQAWQPTLRATASLRAIQGIDVTTELAGMIRDIRFTPGQTVTAGSILVQLNTEPDVAQLHALQATRDINKITYERDKLQYAAQGISKAQLDTDLANLQNAQAQVDQQQATINKKIIRAPFSGKLGISQVNLGQYLNPGDKIVSLQTMDPIWVDFFVPEQEVINIKVGQDVTLTSNTYPNRTFIGKVTSINPAVDTNTRNIEIEATLRNPKGELLPGMYGEVEVSVGSPERFLTLPQAAISYNPYGDLVYVVQKDPKEKNKKEKKGHEKLIVKQKFVTVGKTRGDQVAVLSGIKPGDMIVTAGQLKLKNGTPVVINNSVTPANNPNPQPTDE